LLHIRKYRSNFDRGTSTVLEFVSNHTYSMASLYRLLLIESLFIIIAACSNKTDEATIDEDDRCVNAAGNGNVIIPGPAGLQGGDNDQVFRSLEIDPLNPDVLYIGTE
jgi:hypothetical protein